MPRPRSAADDRYNMARRTTYAPTPDGQPRAIDSMGGRESNPSGGFSSVTVAAAPASAKSVNHFSLQRVIANQCLGTRVYDVDTASADHAYLHPLVLNVLEGVLYPDATLRSSASIAESVKQIFVEIAADPEAAMKVEQFFLPQLELDDTLNQPTPTDSEEFQTVPDANDGTINFVVVPAYVNPPGVSRVYKAKMHYGVKLSAWIRGILYVSGGPYDFEIKPCKRKKDECNTANPKHKAGQVVLKVTIGRKRAATIQGLDGIPLTTDGDLCALVIDKKHEAKLFDHKEYVKHLTPKRGNRVTTPQTAGKRPVREDDDEDLDEASRSTSGVFKLMNEWVLGEFEVGFKKTMGRGDDADVEHLQMTNFGIVAFPSITRVKPVFKTDDDAVCLLNLVVRAKCSIAKDPYAPAYLKLCDNKMLASIKRREITRLVDYVDIEVQVNKSKCKSQSTTSREFDNYWTTLNVMANEREFRDMLNFLIDHFEPVNIDALDRWGRQPDGVWVWANCMYIPGDKHFTELNNCYICPQAFPNMSPSEFPQMTYCPFPWVRYQVLCDLYSGGFDYTFDKNATAARLALAGIVCGWHAHELWAGDGVWSGAAIVYLWSTRHNSGKSTFTSLVQALTGKRQNALSGSSSTFISWLEQSMRDAGLTMVIDDVVTEKSECLVKLVRMHYDKSMHTAHGKENRSIDAPFVLTANDEYHTTDTAHQSRLLTIEFAHEVKQPKSNEFAMLWDVLVKGNKASMFFPDLMKLGVRPDGKLDKYGMQDCANFLTQTVARMRKSRDRCAVVWGQVLYMQLQLTWALQYHEKLDETLEFAVRAFRNHVNERTRMFTLSEKFSIAYLKADAKQVAVCDRNTKPMQCLHLHNRRELTIGGTDYIALRCSSIIETLKNMGCAEDLDYKRLLKEVEIENKVHFYDLKKHPWPIADVRMPMGAESANGGYIHVPRLEDELLAEMCVSEKAFLLPVDQLAELKAYLDGEAVDDINLYEVKIISEYDAKTIKFYDAVKTGEWKGFDALRNTHFAYYNGMKNELYTDQMPRYVDDAPFDDFNHEIKDELEYDNYYFNCPWFRNEPEDQQVPVEFGSVSQWDLSEPTDIPLTDLFDDNTPVPEDMDLNSPKRVGSELDLNSPERVDREDVSELDLTSPERLDAEDLSELYKSPAPVDEYSRSQSPIMKVSRLRPFSHANAAFYT